MAALTALVSCRAAEPEPGTSVATLAPATTPVEEQQLPVPAPPILADARLRASVGARQFDLGEEITLTVRLDNLGTEVLRTEEWGQYRWYLVEAALEGEGELPLTKVSCRRAWERCHLEKPEVEIDLSNFYTTPERERAEGLGPQKTRRGQIRLGDFLDLDRPGRYHVIVGWEFRKLTKDRPRFRAWANEVTFEVLASIDGGGAGGKP